MANTAKFTQELLDEMVARSLEKYRIKEGYGEQDKKWGDLKNQVVGRIKDAFHGVEQEPQGTSRNAGQTLRNYVKDNFGKDQGFGLKKKLRQGKRALQVGAGALGAATIPAAAAAGKVTRAIQQTPNKAREILHNIIGEDEEKLTNWTVPTEYTHFAIRKRDNKIVNGWDYSDVEPEQLRQFPRDYFIVDLEDMGVDPKLFKIATKRGCLSKLGIDPFDPENWSNLSAEDVL